MRKTETSPAEIMKGARLLIAGILLISLTPSLTHSSPYTVSSLTFSLSTDGNAHVTENIIDVNVTVPSINVTIYAKTPSNLIVTDSVGQSLQASPYYYGQYTNYTIDSFGADTVRVEYDTQELTSKAGSIWNFSINTAYNYTLIMPPGISTAIPSCCPFDVTTNQNGQTVFTMPAGESSVAYVLDTANTNPSLAGPLILGAIAFSGGSAATYILIRRNRRRHRKIDAEKIMRAHPELRQEEQEVVNFLAGKNGEAMESEIREAFEKIPKTTMWRLLKRLEEAEVVTLEKVGNQNRVKIK